MTLRRIGILGGMGPEATVLLMQKVIAAVPARDDGDHVPLIVDQNPQVPSRIRHLIERTGEDPGPTLAAMARRLQAAGAEALAMPCNTAHHYAPAIRSAVTIPFIDMVALSAERAQRLAAETGGQVGILASPAVRMTGLFDTALNQFGLTAVFPENDAVMLGLIRQIKAEGVSPAARATLLEASSALLAQGASVQMIACTEFSLIAEAAAPESRAFDTLDCLVDAIVTFACAGMPPTRAG
ncbi:aspartate/glutamate racemase family protein [Arvimicrobium flavum]|uniref:aspartate/glutamate racemase family protein n=1 Tax=Arvimicrobium flavum TaxID=3393320 RepID=UPI00237BD48B|nr:amino acid racemase [Mesorhizobium shangrilense]